MWMLPRNLADTFIDFVTRGRGRRKNSSRLTLTENVDIYHKHPSECVCSEWMRIVSIALHNIWSEISLERIVGIGNQS